MGEIYSEFLDELLQNIRARPISWEAQQRSGVIDDADVRTVKSIDKQRRDKRSEIVSKVDSDGCNECEERKLMIGSGEICPVDGFVD